MHLWWPSKQSNYSTKLIFGVLGKMTHMYMYDPLCALSKNIHLIIHNRNIARGTTDPEIDSVTWIKFSNNMAPLAFVANLATR